ncbi:MAG: hypothetical protein KDI01_08145 [Halioglobus sp.]|nr:hypothetical protein [Halioglobus sp.]
MTATVPNLTRAQVSQGQRLPEIRQQVTATTVILGALASRDWRPMHHDRDFAIERNGMRDIFINTPNNQAWFERLITDWTGPKGRLGRLRFKMKQSVYPGDEMVLGGTVTGIDTDAVGCCWVDLELAVTVDGQVATECQARVAIPADDSDNPWTRRGEQWQP